MPRGLDKIDQNARAAKERSDAYERGEGFHRGLYLKAGETATGRFCEEGTGVWALWTHPLPLKQGQKYADKTLCLDQAFSAAEEQTYVDGTKECYACQLDGVSRSLRTVINFIRYDEPKVVRDKDNKPIKDANGNYKTDGVEPALVVCSFGSGDGGRISYLESQHGGITRHVVTIHKTGDNKNPYMIDIMEREKLPVEPWEDALFQKKVEPPQAITNLSPRFMSIPLRSLGDMRRDYSGASVPSGFQSSDGNGSAPLPGNPYSDAATSGHMNPSAFGGSSS